MRSYARYWCEVFRLPVTADRSGIERRMHGARRAPAARRARRRPRARSWPCRTWATGTTPAPGSSARGVPFTTVAERLEPAALFDRFVAFRESLGMEVLPLTGGEQPPFELLRERLRAGRMLCLLADRDLTPAGVPVSSSARPRRCPRAPRVLAAATGAALLPVTLWFDDAALAARIHAQVVDPAAAAAGRAGRGDDPAARRRLRRGHRRRTPPTGTCCSGSGRPI